MSTDTPGAEDETIDPPPTEAQRALRAGALGVALGTVLAVLARRAHGPRRA